MNNPLMNRNMLLSFTLALSIVGLLISEAKGLQLAEVQVNEPGEWRTVQVGVTKTSSQITEGATYWWNDLGATLPTKDLEFYWLDEDPTKSLAEEYALVDFEVTTDGPVWMLGFYIEGGGMVTPDEILTPAELAPLGWVQLTNDVIFEYGYDPFGLNPNSAAYPLYQRDSLAGEVFSIRVHTYQPPVLFREVPEPVSIAIFVALGCICTMKRGASRNRLNYPVDRE